MTNEIKLTQTALIIEDTEDFAILLKNYLKELNIFKNIIISNDGKDALLKLKLQDFDFYFIDENLPGRNGLELIKELSETGENRTIRVVYSSASMEKPNAMEALKLGVINFLIKPISKVQIQEKVKTILRKKSPK